jgi:hypothetical protein
MTNTVATVATLICSTEDGLRQDAASVQQLPATGRQVPGLRPQAVLAARR